MTFHKKCDLTLSFRFCKTGLVVKTKVYLTSGQHDDYLLKKVIILHKV